MIQIHPYSDNWPHEFEKLSGELASVLGTLARSITHVGSTSVVGMEAKDVIDIQITVGSEADFPLVEEALARLGCRRILEISSDHIPVYGPQDPLEWKKLIFKEAPGQRRANIHVRVAGRANERYARLFRDYLSYHFDTARCYGRFKETLAKYTAGSITANDAAYSDIKDPVCDLIMILAMNWAEESGWK